MTETSPACACGGSSARFSEIPAAPAIVLAPLSAFALYFLFKPAFILAGFAVAWPQLKVMAAFDLLGPRGAAALQLIEETLAFRMDAWRIPFEVFASILGNTPTFSPIGIASLAVATAFLVHRRMRRHA